MAPGDVEGASAAAGGKGPAKLLALQSEAVAAGRPPVLREIVFLTTHNIYIYIYIYTHDNLQKTTVIDFSSNTHF